MNGFCYTNLTFRRKSRSQSTSVRDDVVGLEQQSLPAVVTGGLIILLDCWSYYWVVPHIIGGLQRVITSNGGMRNAAGSAIIIPPDSEPMAGNTTIFPVIIISQIPPQPPPDPP